MENQLNQLIEGYHSFRKHYFSDHPELFQELTLFGQKPKALVISCSDSRVDPSLLLGCKPGDLFVVRNVANLVPPCECDRGYHGTSAALEFGVCALEVQHVILLGHTQCGGIQSIVRGNDAVLQEDNFISRWMEIAKPSCQKILNTNKDLSFDEVTTLCCEESLINSLNNLQSFPWIQERQKAGKLALHAWYFDLSQGVIQAYNPINKGFSPLTQNIS
jgi:Carbonic anhydrase